MSILVSSDRTSKSGQLIQYASTTVAGITAPLPFNLLDQLGAYYDLSADANDDSGNGNNCTAAEGSGWDTAAVSNFSSGYLSATNDMWAYYAADSSTLNSGGTSFTICGWFNYQTGFPGVTRGLFQKGRTGDSSREWMIQYSANEKITFYISNSSGQLDSVASNTFTASAWHFLCCYCDTVGNQIGISIDNGTFNTATKTRTISDLGGSFLIGNIQYPPASYDSGWRGFIKQVGFWQRKIDATEVEYLFNGGSGRNYNSL